MPGLNVVSWYGMWGPKDMPPDVVGALNAATAEAMRGLETAGRLADLGVEPTYSTPAGVRHIPGHGSPAQR